MYVIQKRIINLYRNQNIKVIIKYNNSLINMKKLYKMLLFDNKYTII